MKAVLYIRFWSCYRQKTEGKFCNIHFFLYLCPIISSANKKEMPDNRKAIIRYKILDKCFSDRYHKYFIEDLMNKVNEQLEDAGLKPVSKKQIYDDIKFMKSVDGWEAPIESYQDGKRKYLRYDRDFSIMETPITEMEVEQLETLIISLSRLQGIPMYDWIEELLANLGSLAKPCVEKLV